MVKLEDVSHRACYNVPSHCAAMRFPSSAIEMMQNGEQSCHDPDDLMISVLDVNEDILSDVSWQFQMYQRNYFNHSILGNIAFIYLEAESRCFSHISRHQLLTHTTFTSSNFDIGGVNIALACGAATGLNSFNSQIVHMLYVCNL